MMQRTISLSLKTRNIAFASIFVLFWVILFFFASAGVRGSDQFWYVSDVRAIMDGDPRSNSLWPHFVFSQDDYLQSRPFVHQGILPYVVALWKGVLDPYSAWVYSNLVFVLGTTIIIYFSTRKLLASQSVAMMGSLLFLLLPSTFWYSTQPMVEPAAGFLCAALVAITVWNTSHHIKFPAIVVISAVGDFVTSIFLPVILASFIFYTWKNVSSNTKNSVLIVFLNVFLFCLTLVIMINKGSTLDFDIIQIMMNGTNDRTNMDIWLREEPISFSLYSYIEKLSENIGMFFQINNNQLFFLPYVLIILLVAVKFIYNIRKFGIKTVYKSQDDILLILTICFLAIGIYLSIIFLHQNQPRYLNIVAPAIIVAFIYLYKEILLINYQKIRYLFMALSFGMLSICAVLATTLRAESIEVAAEVRNIRLDASKYGLLQKKVIAIECYRGGESLRLAYALPEVSFVHIDAQNLASQLQRLKAATGAELYLCQPHQPELIDQKNQKIIATETDRTLRTLGDNTIISSLK